MRNLFLLELYRVRDRRALDHYGWAGDETCGMFEVPSPIDHKTMCVIASTGDDWDHVSISRKTRCPNWQEMEHIKRLFFKDEEMAMQLHMPPSEHINNHPYCLHLWRPQREQIPSPPSFMVGHRSQADVEREIAEATRAKIASAS